MHQPLELTRSSLTVLFVLAALVFASSVGCADDDASAPRSTADAGVDAADIDTDASTDAGVAPDTGTDTTQPDAQEDASADTSAPPACDFPAPIVAGTPLTDSLADAPARCGQAPHTWSRDASLGDVIEIGAPQQFRASLIEGVIRSQNVNPPPGIDYDVTLKPFRYLTQDRGAPIEATGLVGFPQDFDTAEPLPTLLVLHGTTGFMDDCAPSADTASQALVALFASFGYVVVAPDFIGLKGSGEPSADLHPYLVGQATAIASLDSVRALGKMAPDERGGYCLSDEVMVVGGSQGGHAALWVDRLAPYYARELDLLGAVATVPPADLIGQMERALNTFVNSTGNTIAFLGTAASWYGFDDRLDEVFAPPLDVDIPAALGTDCSPGTGFADPTVEDIFQPSLYEPARLGELTEVDPWGCITAENGLTTTSIERIAPESDSYGILSVLAEQDELVHTPIERDAFATLCEQGVDMQYLECAGADHVEATLFAVPEILDFIAARMAREPFNPPNLCEVQAAQACRGTP